MCEPARLTISRNLRAPAGAAFDAWLDAESAAQWLFATPGGVMEKVEINPRVGGAFTINERRGGSVATHFGVFVELDRPTRLVFDFATDAEIAPTRVSVDFASHPGGCRVTLSHKVEPRWAAYDECIRSGWKMILDGLARSLGDDDEA